MMDLEEMQRRLLRCERQTMALKSVLKQVVLIFVGVLSRQQAAAHAQKQLDSVLETLETIRPIRPPQT